MISTSHIPESVLNRLPDFIDNALKEDVSTGDHSSNACISDSQMSSAKLLVKEDCVIAGVALAQYMFQYIDEKVEIERYKSDGERVVKGDIVFLATAKTRTLLMIERLMLNCMQRMSGIATKTADLQSLISHTNSKLLDTRKTTPGMRFLEKWAVKIGGGENHRFGLYDMIMLKDNHLDASGGIEKAIKDVHKYLIDNQLDLKIEVETRNLDEVKQVMQIGGIHRIMLDNFSPVQIVEALKIIDNQYETEASGGITESNIIEYAETGVDYISTSQITHSVKSIDLSFKILR